MKKQLALVLMILAFPAICIISCTKANREQQTATTCDTVNMSYANDIVPILQSNCYSCHGNGNTGGSGGILLDGYSNLLPHVNDGSLRGVTTHSPGYTAMPYGLPKLDDCTINKIIDWINHGAQNN